MSTILEIRLSEEQLEDLAERIAAKIGRPTPGRPMTAKEAADALNVNTHTIYRWIKAGKIREIPGLGHVRIPIGEIERLQSGRALEPT